MLPDGGRRDVDPLSMAALQNYLQGVDFPADKEEVASAAESNGAPQEIVEKIRNADRERFDNSNYVFQEGGLTSFRKWGAPRRATGETLARERREQSKAEARSTVQGLEQASGTFQALSKPWG